ncbi:MAG TPA: Ppx/GppA phosphatase family protein [Bacteroidota bacterium]|nr:Ppx/GppA phosphatase family protein [Bacteroidota bacterium]
MKTQKRNLAAIDVGTNSIHLIVAEVDPETAGFRTLGREKALVRLGSGSTDMKYLSEPAMDRALLALKRFKKIADASEAQVRAIATSAVREALNKEEFIRRVRSETGIRIEIASGVEEARLIHLGVLQALPVYSKRHLMIDIGGGSTEFLLGHEREVLFNNSLKLGAVRLSERFFKTERTRKEAIEECRNYVRGILAPVERGLHGLHFDLAIGSSGTITNLAQIVNVSRGGAVDALLNGFVFTRRELDAAVERILACRDAEERSLIPGLDPSRADIIVAGALIIDEIFEVLSLKSMTVSDFALREGIILDTIEKFFRTRRLDHLHDIRFASVLHIAEQFRYEKKHARQVAQLALQIFDQTEALHHLGATERMYLESAAILHEVGLFVSHAQHHRHSYYLIRNAELLGFTENEKEIVANIARYHRKSHPKVKHEGYNRLDPDEQDVVHKLASILRIADGLDRTHMGVIKEIEVVRKGNRSGVTQMIIRHHTGGDELELWGAERKKELFEKTFKTRVEFKT